MTLYQSTLQRVQNWESDGFRFFLSDDDQLCIRHDERGFAMDLVVHLGVQVCQVRNALLRERNIALAKLLLEV